ncbi:hypothetical protein ACWENS_10535 [Streptomyces sp. NPDC004532]
MTDEQATPAPADVLRQRIAEALTAAAFECDGKCGLAARECYDAHPIILSAVSNGTTHVDAPVTAIADAVLAVMQPEHDRLDRIRDAARLHRQQLISTSELYAVIEAMDATAATEATEPFIDRPFRSHRTSEPAPDAGPTVREAAADDRRWWNSEKAGE